MAREDFLTFKDKLFSSLLWAINTEEIDNVIDTFLREISIYYNLEASFVFFPSGDLIILRGVFGVDRYFVCKIAYTTENNYIEDHIFASGDRYIGKNINISHWDILGEFETMLSLPIKLFSNSIGVFTTRSSIDKIEYFNEIFDEIKTLVNHFAVYASGILRSVECRDRNRYITILSEMVVRFSFSKDLEVPLNNLAYDITNIFNVRKSIIVLFDDNKNICFSSAQGFEINQALSAPFIQNYSESSIPCCINGVEYIDEYRDYRYYVEHSIMILPLKIGDNLLGIVAAIDKIPDAINPLGDFIETDMHLFRNILSHISSNINLHNTLDLLNKETKRNEIHANKLNILYELSNALLGKLKEDDIIFILLTAMTLGEAFGHNRSFAFFYDEKNNSFNGAMSVAPIDGNDAANVWNALENTTTASVREKLLLLYTKRDLKNISSLTKKVQKLSIPADEKCILFKNIVKNKKPIIVQSVDSNDKKIQQIQSLTDLLGFTPFAIIPMLGASQQCIGLIVVDNYFTNNPIEEDDINYKKMFANQIAIAVEYSRLYESIEQKSIELRTTQDKLTEASHLALIGQMSSSISHNLRNFIVPITGFANRLKRITGLDDEVKKYIDIISEEMTKLEYYIKSNLSFSKAVQLRIEDIPISSIENTMKNMAEECIVQSKKKIKLNIVCSIDEISVSWDYMRMSEVFLNLILNAIDAVPEDKHSTITIIIEISSYDSSLINLHIKNSHSYINKKIRKEIFDPFFTTKSHGSGLGLPSSLRIIEAHKGSISLDTSLKPKFTDFIITIPITVQ